MATNAANNGIWMFPPSSASANGDQASTTGTIIQGIARRRQAKTPVATQKAVHSGNRTRRGIASSGATIGRTTGGYRKGRSGPATTSNDSGRYGSPPETQRLAARSG